MASASGPMSSPKSSLELELNTRVEDSSKMVISSYEIAPQIDRLCNLLDPATYNVPVLFVRKREQDVVLHPGYVVEAVRPPLVGHVLREKLIPVRDLN